MDRPYVILSAAMTLDGKIATAGSDSQISCEKDLDRVHRLRAGADAVMVGIGTVRADDPSLTVRRARGKNPVRVVVDSLARTPPNAKVLDGSAPVIIAVAKNAPKRKVQKLRTAGAKVVVTGKKEVDLQDFLKQLCAFGAHTLLLEGGSTLNWSMLKHGLVDEVRVAIAPRIVGGAKAKTLVGGEGFAKISEGVVLEPLSVGRVGRDLLLIYRVKGGKGAAKT